MSKEKYLWVDQYRPKTVNEYVWADDSQKSQVMNWISERHLPNLLLTGGPGVGKSSLAKCLLNELNVHSSDIRYVNGSHTNGVDDIRSLSNFAETMPGGDFRYVVLDECLDEETLVWILRNGEEISISIKELNQISDLVKSYNIEHNRIEWRPFELFDKGNREVLEIEFENNEIVICTPEHKWYVEDEITHKIKEIRADELFNYNYILTI